MGKFNKGDIVVFAKESWKNDFQMGPLLNQMYEILGEAFFSPNYYRIKPINPAIMQKLLPVNNNSTYFSVNQDTLTLIRGYI